MKHGSRHRGLASYWNHGKSMWKSMWNLILFHVETTFLGLFIMMNHFSWRLTTFFGGDRKKNRTKPCWAIFGSEKSWDVFDQRSQWCLEMLIQNTENEVDLIRNAPKKCPCPSTNTQGMSSQLEPYRSDLSWTASHQLHQHSCMEYMEIDLNIRLGFCALIWKHDN